MPNKSTAKHKVNFDRVPVFFFFYPPNDPPYNSRYQVRNMRRVKRRNRIVLGRDNVHSVAVPKAIFRERTLLPVDRRHESRGRAGEQNGRFDKRVEPTQEKREPSNGYRIVGKNQNEAEQTSEAKRAPSEKTTEPFHGCVAISLRLLSNL